MSHDLLVQMAYLGRLFSGYLQHCWLIIQAPVVGKVDNDFNSDNACPLDSDFSGG